MQSKEGTFNILFLDVSPIASWAYPQGLKWMKEWEAMKHMNDQEGENESWEEKAAGVFIILPTEAEQLCAFPTIVYLKVFVLSLEGPFLLSDSET